MRSGPTHHEIQKLAQRQPRLLCVPEVGVPCHVVPIASADLGLMEVPLLHQVADDLLNGTLSDPDRLGHVPHSGAWIASQRDKDVAMIRQERPATFAHGRIIREHAVAFRDVRQSGQPLGGPQVMVMPPSTARVWPVT